MEASLKAKWIEALRSGKYKQGRFKLRTRDDCYCCLGVLCDVSNISEWEVNGSSYSYDGALSFLPPSLWSQLTPEERDYLMQMNDRGDMSFPIIADWIAVYVEEDQ